MRHCSWASLTIHFTFCKWRIIDVWQYSVTMLHLLQNPHSDRPAQTHTITSSPSPLPRFPLLAEGTYLPASDQQVGGPGNKATITVPLAYWQAVVHNLLPLSIRYPADVQPVQPSLKCRTKKSQVCQWALQMLVSSSQENCYTKILWSYLSSSKRQSTVVFPSCGQLLWRNLPPKLRLTHAQLWSLKKRATYICRVECVILTKKSERTSSRDVWIPNLKDINKNLNFISWDGLWVLQRRCCPLWPFYSAPLLAFK